MSVALGNRQARKPGGMNASAPSRRARADCFANGRGQTAGKGELPLPSARDDQSQAACFIAATAATLRSARSRKCCVLKYQSAVSEGFVRVRRKAGRRGVVSRAQDPPKCVARGATALQAYNPTPRDGMTRRFQAGFSHERTSLYAIAGMHSLIAPRRVC